MGTNVSCEEKQTDRQAERDRVVGQIGRLRETGGQEGRLRETADR